jgi:general secretion pathway protein C
MAGTQKSKKTATEIAQAVEDRIVEVSLHNPDYGARRLVPLLAEEGILLTTSEVYTILTRNGLQNRTLRLSKLEEQPAVDMVLELADTLEPQAEEPDPVPAHTIEVTPESPKSPAIKSSSKSKARRPWSLTVPNLLLLAIVGYFWVSAAANFLQAGREPGLLPQLVPTKANLKPQAAVRPLEDYNIIVERNLFGGSKEEGSATQEEISLEGLPVALKVLGLKLVGTVVGDDAAVNLAIIDNQSTRKQELFHEGDRVGEALVKKILRNKVVLNTGSGDEVLTMEPEEKAGSFSARQQPLTNPPPTPADSDDLTREEVDSAIPEYSNLMRQIRVRPHFEEGKPGGFMVYNIESGSIYAKMGLENGDVIKSVNGHPIETTQQAVEFYNGLKEGGAVTLEIKRGESTQELRFAIQ